MVNIMTSESLLEILESNRELIFKEMCTFLEGHISNNYREFVLKSSYGQSRLSIFVNMALEALRSSPTSFYEDQQKVGYYRAVQGYSLSDVTNVPLSFVDVTSKILQRQYKTINAIPSKLVRELIDADKVILNSLRLVAQAYITTREERIASEINNLKRLYCFTQNIMSTFDIKSVLNFVSSELEKIFQTDVAVITLAQSGRLDHRLSSHQSSHPEELFPLMQQSFNEHIPLFLDEAGVVLQDIESPPLKRAVTAPIKGHEAYHGAVALASFNKGFRFTQKEMAYLEQFLLISSIVIDNSLMFDELQTNTHRMRLLTQKALSIREEEKKRIAEDIHDTLTQSLTGISYKLQYCYEVCDQHPQLLKDELAEINSNRATRHQAISRANDQPSS